MVQLSSAKTSPPSFSPESSERFNVEKTNMTKFNEKIGTYLHLTRKELQRLCKIHKLPANKSHYELANSLVSFFKEKNSRSPIVLERANLGSCIKIVNSEWERENVEKKHESSQKEIDKNSTINIITESSDSEPNSKTQTLKSQSFTKTLDSIIPKVGLQKPVSFEYSVYSEEGINFYIDLNPYPSEWNNNLNKENLVNSISPALSENIQTETTQNPNSQIKETGQENQDKNKNTNNNDYNTYNNINKDKNENFDVTLKNEDSELRAHLLVSCQNNEKKLKREKVIRGKNKIDSLTDEKSVIILDSSGDEGDVSQAKAKNSSELLDENQALDKNSKRQYNQDTEEFWSPNKRHQFSDETKNIEKNVNMKNTRASMQDPQCESKNIFK